MSDFAAVCIGILTVTHLVGLVLLVFILLHIRRASMVVGLAGIEAYEQFKRIGGATQKMSEFAHTVRSGWMRALTLALGAAAILVPAARGGRDGK